MRLVPQVFALLITQKKELKERGFKLGSQFEGDVIHHGMESVAAEPASVHRGRGVRLLAHILVGQEAAWIEVEPGHSP